MFLPIVLFSVAAATGPTADPHPVTSASISTGKADGHAALALFQSDALLNYWALKHYDSDGDIMLSTEEAAGAADAFKAIADGNRDGRVSPYEYQRAREFIVARF